MFVYLILSRDLRDAGLKVFNRFPLGDFVFRGRLVVVQGRQVGERGTRRRPLQQSDAAGRRRQRSHRFQLDAKAVVCVVRVHGGGVFAAVRRQRRLAAAERSELRQYEPPGVPALLDHGDVARLYWRAQTTSSVACAEHGRGRSLYRTAAIGTQWLRALDEQVKLALQKTRGGDVVTWPYVVT